MIIQILISFSALLASCAFIYPLWSAEQIFIFLMPLFYAVIKSKFSVSYKEGFLWGALFYFFYFYDLFMVIIYRGNGWVRGVAVIFLFTYACLYTTLWFWLAQKFSYYTQKSKSNSFIALMPWGVITWFYFYWIDSAFFWIFGNWEGNQLNHPIVPLAIRPQWLYFLPFLGKNGFFFLIVIFCMSSIVLITQYQRISIVIILFCCLVFLYGWMPSIQQWTMPDWINKVGYLASQSTDQNAGDVAEKITVLLEEFVRINPSIDTIIMPESTFKFPLNVLSRYIQLWPLEGILLIIGSHRKEGDNLLNTLYLIKDGRIIDFYDKSHTLFFTERIPWLWGYFSGSKELFLKEHRVFSQSNQIKKMHLESLGEVIPLVCSELFFLKSRLDSHSLAISIVNDSWFFSNYIPRLMVLHAKVIAISYRCSMLYVGYHYGSYINDKGNQFFLPTFSR